MFIPIVALTIVYAVYLVAAANDTSSRTPPVASVFLVPLSTIAAYVVIRRVARHETRFDLRTIMLTGFVLRLFGAYLRWSDPADALEYHQVGIDLSRQLRQFDLWPETGRGIPGTGWLRYVTGVVQVFTSDDLIATFLVFTVLAFIGTFLCYRAFVRAVPEGNHRKYALLLFLWPSLWFWPSSIGKESWMILALGVTCWGVARFYTNQPAIGLGIIAAGIVLMSLLRPHVALIVLVGFTVALLARGADTRSTARLVVRTAAVILVLVGGSMVSSRAAVVLKVDSTGADDISQALEQTSTQTSQGTGEFNAAIVRSPLDYPAAFVTVWFRPLPWEARNGVAQMLSGAENLLLFGVVIGSWRRLKHIPRAMLRLPYAAFAASYSLAFVFAFSAIGNFGILARQRTQGLIVIFVVLCIPIMPATGAGAGYKKRSILRRGDKRDTGLIDRAHPAPDVEPEALPTDGDRSPVSVAAQPVVSPYGDRFPVRRRRSP